MISREAFWGCTNLANVLLPDSVEEIGLDAFRECGIKSFIAPGTMRIIHQSAFQDCWSLKYAKLNEGLEVLGTNEYPDGHDWCGVFYGSALEEVVLPSTLKRIEYYAFAYCKNLRRIQLPN